MGSYYEIRFGYLRRGHDPPDLARPYAARAGTEPKRLGGWCGVERGRQRFTAGVEYRLGVTVGGYLGWPISSGPQT